MPRHHVGNAQEAVGGLGERVKSTLKRAFVFGLGWHRREARSPEEVLEVREDIIGSRVPRNA
jgi:hypothetical protein